MKILHVTATHLKKSGGIPVVLKNLVKYQNRINNVESKVLSIKEDIDDMESEYFFLKKSKSEISKFIDDYDPDVVIIHSLYFLEYTKISKLLYKKGKQYYIEPHSSFGSEAQRKSKYKKICANNLLFKNFINNAYGYIFLNESEQRDSKYRKETDIVIPNGIEIRDIRLEKNPESVKLYFLGRLDVAHKGLDYLVGALEKLDDKKVSFEIDFFGTGTEKEVNYIKSHISKLKNIKSCYKGPVYDKEKDKELSNYDIMILTSRYEGFPVTVLEALHYGCPCIVSNGTNVKDIIENNNLGWGCSFDDIPETIERAIKEYKSNRNHYQSKTIEFVTMNYSWEKIAEESIEKLSI